VKRRQLSDKSASLSSPSPAAGCQLNHPSPAHFSPSVNCAQISLHNQRRVHINFALDRERNAKIAYSSLLTQSKRGRRNFALFLMRRASTMHLGGGMPQFSSLWVVQKRGMQPLFNVLPEDLRPADDIDRFAHKISCSIKLRSIFCE
jgi:hypothetical protein